jgi:hypothetical protein
MQLENQSVVFDACGRPASQRIAFFTSLCPLRSGAILAGFQLGSGKHSADATIQLCRSIDEGMTWHELPARFSTSFAGIPGSLAAPEMVEVEPSRLLLFCTWFDRSDPSRPLFDPVTEGVLRSRLLTAVSTDEGSTWSEWKALSLPGLTGCAGTGPALRWPNGMIGFALESFKEFDDPRPARHAAWLVVSRDGGHTFSQPLLVAQHPENRIYYWDQRLSIAGDDGEFVAMFWTHDLEQKRDLRVHIRRGTVGRESIDLQPIRETAIPGQIAAPLLLADGRLLAFVVDRARPGTMKLWVSPDGGRNWPEKDSLLVHLHDERAAVTQGQSNIDFKKYWEDMGKWSFGHPALRSLGRGRVLVAWYAGTPDCMSIHSAQIRMRTLP